MTPTVLLALVAMAGFVAASAWLIYRFGAIMLVVLPILVLILLPVVGPHLDDLPIALALLMTGALTDADAPAGDAQPAAIDPHRRPNASRETGVVARVDEASRRTIYREFRACWEADPRGGGPSWTPASSLCAERLLEERDLTDQELRRIESEGREKGWGH